MTIQNFSDWLKAVEKDTDLGNYEYSEWGQHYKVKIWLEEAWCVGYDMGKRAQLSDDNTFFDFTPYEDTPFGEWPDEAKLAAFKGVLIDKDEWQYHCFLSKDWKKSDAYKHGFNMSNRYRPKPIEET